MEDRRTQDNDDTGKFKRKIRNYLYEMPKLILIPIMLFAGGAVWDKVGDILIKDKSLVVEETLEIALEPLQSGIEKNQNEIESLYELSKDQHSEQVRILTIISKSQNEKSSRAGSKGGITGAGQAR